MIVQATLDWVQSLFKERISQATVDKKDIFMPGSAHRTPFVPVLPRTAVRLPDSEQSLLAGVCRAGSTGRPSHATPQLEATARGSEKDLHSAPPLDKNHSAPLEETGARGH